MLLSTRFKKLGFVKAKIGYTWENETVKITVIIYDRFYIATLRYGKFTMTHTSENPNDVRELLKTITYFKKIESLGNIPFNFSYNQDKQD